MLLQYGFGLIDVVKCYSGVDVVFFGEVWCFDELCCKVEYYCLCIVVFISKCGVFEMFGVFIGKLFYGLQLQLFDWLVEIELWVLFLMSLLGYNYFWLEFWQVFGDWVCELCGVVEVGNLFLEIFVLQVMVL